MTGKRVLIVGDYCRSGFGAQYYNTNFVLQTGFIRAGNHVLTFSDRDVAREASVFRRKALGRAQMNRQLIDTARTYQPHLVLFGHADLADAETFAAIRRLVPGTRLAQFNVDALFRTKTMRRFKERAQHLDLSFITTAAPDRLRALFDGSGTIAYFPNPVDPAIAMRDVSQIARADLAFDGIFLGTAIERREQQISALQEALPANVRFHAAGGVQGTSRLSGPAFLDALATGAMSPNLPLDETRPVDFLYASDRLAQLLAHGIVAFCQSDAGLDAIYEDGIVNYDDIPDLAHQLTELAGDDDHRRSIATTGRRIGVERTSAERVAQYMLDLTLGDGPSMDYGWPNELV